APLAVVVAVKGRAQRPQGPVEAQVAMQALGDPGTAAVDADQPHVATGDAGADLFEQRGVAGLGIDGGLRVHGDIVAGLSPRHRRRPHPPARPRPALPGWSSARRRTPPACGIGPRAAARSGGPRWWPAAPRRPARAATPPPGHPA